MFDGTEGHEINIRGLEGYSIRGLSLDAEDSADATGQNSPNEEEVALDEDSCSSTDSDPSKFHIFNEEDESEETDSPPFEATAAPSPAS